MLPWSFVSMKPAVIVPADNNADPAAANLPPVPAGGETNPKAYWPLTCPVEKAVGSCFLSTPDPVVPVVSNSISRPLVATFETIEPRENRKTEVTAEPPNPVTTVRHPRLSVPIVYELPAELIVRGVASVVLPDTRLKSSTPTMVAM